MRTTRKKKPAISKSLEGDYLIDFLIALLAGLVVLALDKIS